MPEFFAIGPHDLPRVLNRYRKMLVEMERGWYTDISFQVATGKDEDTWVTSFLMKRTVPPLHKLEGFYMGKQVICERPCTPIEKAQNGEDKWMSEGLVLRFVEKDDGTWVEYDNGDKDLLTSKTHIRIVWEDE